MRRLFALCLLAALPGAAAEPSKPTPAQVEYFERHVRPLLTEQCVGCHGPKKQKGGLRLDTAAGLAKGTEDGPVVVPGEPGKSKLMAAVMRKGDAPMPPDSALSEDQMKVLADWIKGGAAFPPDVGPSPADPKAHWAFQPPKEPKGTGHGIDTFVNAKLAELKLTPTAKADKRTLARRAYFDLLGLPPTADDLDAFEKDADPKAYEKLLDKLLADPRYGERWGRYWLDVARYADSKGYVFTEERTYPYAYTYRDYVVRSFNDDLPYDRFVQEQIAADKLVGDDKRPLAAMGFLTVGRRFSNNIHDITDDRIDVVTRGLMGLTVSCARCHDHKFDPIPTADYYSLYAVFAGSHEPKELPQVGDPADAAATDKFLAEVAKLDKAVADEREKRLNEKKGGVAALGGGLAFGANAERLFNRADRDAVTAKQKVVDTFKAKSPAAPPRAMVMFDNAQPAEGAVFVRGNPNNRGAKVPRQMPAVTVAEREPFKDGSGRLDMAKGIASKDNPLFARVMVNRVWGWHFGAGLVRTASDFGIRSDPPTHPELLDWLALRFVEDGWSVKKLHKRIMLSEAYTRGSGTTPEAAKADPENRWLSHSTRRRLDWEATRDSLLAASGQLDDTRGGRPVDLFKAPFSRRRAVYGFIDRQNLPGTLQAFDFASPEQHTPFRFQTTVPQQALFLMNSPFVTDAARATAARSEVARATDPAEKAKAIYRAVLARDPTKEEAELATAFVTLADPQAKGKLTAWEQLAQVLLMSNEFAFVD